MAAGGQRRSVVCLALATAALMMMMLGQTIRADDGPVRVIAPGVDVEVVPNGKTVVKVGGRVVYEGPTPPKPSDGSGRRSLLQSVDGATLGEAMSSHRNLLDTDVNVSGTTVNVGDKVVTVTAPAGVKVNVDKGGRRRSLLATDVNTIFGTKVTVDNNGVTVKAPGDVNVNTTSAGTNVKVGGKRAILQSVY